MSSVLCSLALACLAAALALAAAAPAGSASSEAPKAWPVGKTYEMKGLKVTLSAPMLVGEQKMAGKDWYWYPQVARLTSGELLAVSRLGPDNLEADAVSKIGFSWSADGGQTWSPTKALNKGHGYSSLTLPNGDLLMLPFILYRRGDALVGPANVISKTGREVKFIENAVEVTGWPRPDAHFAPSNVAEAARFGYAAFFFNGQTVRLKDGKYLATLYGSYKGDKKFTLVAAESADGMKWKLRSTIAGPECPEGGMLGPCESAIARLKDGRIMCVFGQASPYGQCFSEDEGKSWTKPARMPAGVGGVEPSLAVLKDGTAVLSGGNRQVSLWFNPEGDGKEWQGINVYEHHNAVVAPERRFGGKAPYNGCTGYTEVVATEDNSVVLIYDCMNAGGNFTICVARATLGKTR